MRKEKESTRISGREVWTNLSRMVLERKAMNYLTERFAVDARY